MITISESVISDILVHVNQEFPNEGCGYLGGTATFASDFQAMTNTLNSPKEFAFDPKEQFETVRHFRASGLSIIGVVHSHPNGIAKLSSKDIDFADPNLFQLIVIPKTDEIAAFTVQGNVITNHKINIK